LARRGPARRRGSGVEIRLNPASAYGIPEKVQLPSCVDLYLSVALGTAFGLLGAACAFVISYAEYKRNWSFRGNATHMALRSALVTFLFFLVAAVALGAIFEYVRWN
jgi:hypothetical protein